MQSPSPGHLSTVRRIIQISHLVHGAPSSTMVKHDLMLALLVVYDSVWPVIVKSIDGKVSTDGRFMATVITDGGGS